jgi:plastocyanin
VRKRLSYLALAAALGVGVAVLPALAASESLPVEAVNEGLYYHHWSNPVQTVIAGDTVKFSNPYGNVPHGLKFTSSTKPTCSGIPPAATEETGAVEWHGECTFSTPGSYTFVCTVHPGEMKGTITVNPNGTTTTTTTSTPPTGTTPGETPPSSPLVGGPSIRANQHHGIVKGALEISQAGAGDRLDVNLLATHASLASVARVTVGHFTIVSVKAGHQSFSVKLSAKAKRVLHRRKRLPLIVSIVLTPAHGKPTTVTRSVVERS